MPAALNETFELHRHILRDLTLREAAITNKEAEARKAFEQMLQTYAAEKGAIQQHRELLAQAETLYRRFADAHRDDSAAAVPQPSEAPPAAAASDQSFAPASLRMDENPSGLALAALPPPDVEIAATLDSLRNQIISAHMASPEPVEPDTNRRWLGRWKA